MYGPKDKARSPKPLYIYLTVHHRYSYHPLHHLLPSRRATMAEVLVKVLTVYRGVDLATAAMEMVLMANITIAAVLMRNMREILVREA